MSPSSKLSGADSNRADRRLSIEEPKWVSRVDLLLLETWFPSTYILGEILCRVCNLGILACPSCPLATEMGHIGFPNPLLW